MKTQSRFGVTIPGISPGHELVTVTDSDTIDFTASGTDNQTITADVIIDPAVDNITTATVDGVYTKLIDEVTYAELAALISGSDLIQGRQYLITDYATKHYMLNGVLTILSATNTATTEPIIVTATTSNTLSPVAYSTIYKDDILHYDWNPANWINDPAFSNVDTAGMNLGTIIPGWKGVIIYREDTKQKNITHYDFRGVKFRRWALNPTAWNSGTTYARKAKVIVGTKIYTSRKAGNTNNLVTDTTWWAEVFDIVNTAYWAYTTTNISDIPVDSLDFIDVPTFAYNYNFVFANNYIGPKHSEDSGQPYVSILPNIVFIGSGHTDDERGYEVHDNRIEGGSDFGNSTIGDFFKFNTIGFNFNYNLIGSDVAQNDFKSSAYLNIIYGGFQKNILGTQFFTNELSNGFSQNSVGHFFYNNIIGTNFNNNFAGNNFASNNIGNSFSDNTTGQYFTSNNIGNTFYRNTTGEGMGLCTILDEFRNNTMQGAQSVDFTAATHVYQAYTKLHFITPDGTETLQYINDANTVVIANSNA